MPDRDGEVVAASEVGVHDLWLDQVSVFLNHRGGWVVIGGTHPPRFLVNPQTHKCPSPTGGGGLLGTHPPTNPPDYHRQNALPQAKCLDQRLWH